MRTAISSSRGESIAQVLVYEYEYELRRRGHNVSAVTGRVRALDGVV
ncbi:MAG: hypothetical protein JO362_21565 [Streptomycetaceae bacterium]|nr:hypothetical protein [Streptomycetaceae bacterium]